MNKPAATLAETKKHPTAPPTDKVLLSNECVYLLCSDWMAWTMIVYTSLCDVQFKDVCWTWRHVRQYWGNIGERIHILSIGMCFPTYLEYNLATSLKIILHRLPFSLKLQAKKLVLLYNSARLTSEAIIPLQTIFLLWIA